jgi:hypothetical protein
MSGTIDAQRAWATRVLGVAFSGPQATAGGGAAGSTWKAVRQTWQAASDTVDGQISTLQAKLRADGDETLKQIAEFGMNGLTGNFKVPLMAALSEIDAGGAAAIAKVGPKALSIIEAFRNYISTDEKVEVCDENPLGVAVSIRATLGGALAQMAATLQAQVKA